VGAASDIPRKFSGYGRIADAMLESLQSDLPERMRVLAQPHPVRRSETAAWFRNGGRSFHDVKQNDVAPQWIFHILLIVTNTKAAQPLLCPLGGTPTRSPVK